MIYGLLSSGTFRDYGSFQSSEMYSRLAWVRIVLTNCTCGYEKVSQAILHRLVPRHVILELWNGDCIDVHVHLKKDTKCKVDYLIILISACYCLELRSVIMAYSGVQILLPKAQ